MFEVGQMVRRTYGNSEGMEIGDVGRVKTIIDSEWVELEEYGGRHLIDRLELIEDEKFINEYIINHLDKKISNLVKEDPERRIKRLESDIQDLKYTIERHRRYMNDAWTQYKQTMDQIEFYKNKEIKTFKDDIESLLNHKYVENILVKGSELVITTKYIDIFDEKGNRFKGNKYELVFKFSEMTCYIYGLDEDYCRQSYWTYKDPHPHVNGEIGEACWGSAGSMLTENMNEHEIYASFIIVLNFLQQVNTEDAAGKYIRNWDCVDEDDDIIDNPYEVEMKECTICSEEMEEGEAYYCEDCQEYACEEHTIYIDLQNKYVCDHCYDEGYAMCDNCSNKDDYSDMTEHDGGIYCSSCYTDLFSECECCGDVFDNNELNTINGEGYCDDCYEDKFADCDECGDCTKREELTIVDGNNYCKECADEVLTTCDECGFAVREDETFNCGVCKHTFCNDCKEEKEDRVCEDCYEEKEEEEVELYA